MNLWITIGVGFKEIWAHRFRSLLTMLGIILGVSSLIAMSAMVKGMENGMREAMIAIGGLQKVTIVPESVPPYQQHLADQAVGITMNDVYALKESAPLVGTITPQMHLMRPTVSRNGKNFNPVVAAGTWPSANEMNQHTIEHGRMFNEIDEENARSVCVIGTAIRDELFGAPEDVGREIIPIGEKINLNGQLFTVVGMFKHYESDQDRKKREFEMQQPKEKKTGPTRNRGWSGRGGGFVFWMKNATIYIPLNTMWMKFRAASGKNNVPDPRLTVLHIKIKDIEHMEVALQQARNVLMHTHGGIEDFTFRTQEGWSEDIGKAIRNARLSGGFIAAISLVVGGIGIMNIMFASITERIREIGIRKAIGATTFAVFIQILVESLVIAILGGFAGLATSYGLVKLLSTLSPTDNAPQITAASMGIAFAFSVCVGLIAGVLPAMKAARLDPIQALRYD